MGLISNSTRSELTMRSREIDLVLTAMFLLMLIMLGSLASAQITMDEAKVIAAYPLTTEKMEKKYSGRR